MFVAVFSWPCTGETPNVPSASEWMNKLSSIHAVEHGSAMKRTQLWSHVSALGLSHTLLLYCLLTDTFQLLGRGRVGDSCEGRARCHRCGWGFYVGGLAPRVSDVQGASVPTCQGPAYEPGGLRLQGARVKAMCGALEVNSPQQARYLPGRAWHPL